MGHGLAQQPSYRIGYQLPLTGNTAQYGQDFKNAAGPLCHIQQAIQG
jgi:branched-chain amino acid transport system substrate-binding protein